MPQNLREYVPAFDDERDEKVPVAIRAFGWLCFFRSGLDFIFALLVGLAPKSPVAIIVAAAFAGRIPNVPAEAEFYIFGFLFAFVGWKWMDRYWWIRWVAMFLSGALAVRILVFILADNASAAHGKFLQSSNEIELGVIAAFNLFISGYLAFYPGVAEAFKETS